MSSDTENRRMKMPIPLPKVLKGGNGQSLVEFALVVPLLLVLVFGILEFSRAWMTKNVLTGAAREAVRVAVVPGGSVSAGITRGDEVLASAGLPPGTSIHSAGGVHGTITATATYDFTPAVLNFIPGLPNTIQLSSTTSMRKE
jgi:Flp pilus assembly protein TadG